MALSVLDPPPLQPKDLTSAAPGRCEQIKERFPRRRRTCIQHRLLPFVRYLDGEGALIGEINPYESLTTELDPQGNEAYVSGGDLTVTHDELVWEAKMTSPDLTGEETSFHMALSTDRYKDNRIPPRGFTNAAYADFGGSPVDYSYADGQYWDDTYYNIPLEANSVEVKLYYQSTSKEFIEFLRDENKTTNDGNDMYDIWVNNGKCPPELMQSDEITLTLQTDFNGDGVDFTDFAIFASYWGNDCDIDCGLANLDNIGGIDAADLARFVETWLWGK